MDIGERWAYRERKDKSLVEVEILALGKPGTSPKVKVRHLDDFYEGKVEWSPKLRLKCLWAEIESYSSREASWAKAQTPDLTRGEIRAYEHVYVAMTPTGMVDWDTYGCTIIPDVDRLLGFAGLDRTVLETPRSFRDSEGLVVPWTSTLAIVKAIVRRNPGDIAAWVDAEEERWTEVRAERKQSLDDWLHPDRDDPRNVQLRWVGEARRADVECWALLREWTGQPAYEVGADNQQMRTLIAEFADAALSAIDDLPKARTKGAMVTRARLEVLIRAAGRWL